MLMPRSRYLLILKYLHFNDNTCAVDKDHPLHDKLYKVRLILDRVQESFPMHFIPNQHISINEQMIGTKARISFLQYLPKKPKKWGVKLWVLADSSTGYVPAFSVYTRASNDGVTHGLAYHVVMDLMEQYLNQGYKVYVDNFYTSLWLFISLYEQGTLACGTVRTNRKGLPKAAITKKLDRGDAVFKIEKHTGLIFVHWKDKRDVFCLSSFHDNTMEDFTTKRTDVSEVRRPVLIGDYNKNMGGVDQMDQMLVYYALGRKSIKWYKRIFWRIIEIALVNSFILHRICHPQKKLTQKSFGLCLPTLLSTTLSMKEVL